MTGVVAVVEPGRGGTGPARLRWSNAGHPPPVLLCADDRGHVLERTPERPPGGTPGTPRSEHEVPLHAGDTLLLYTDGLVERRDRSLDDGTADLLRTVRGLAHVPLDELCDRLLAGLQGRVEDDVALLAVRLTA